MTTPTTAPPPPTQTPTCPPLTAAIRKASQQGDRRRSDSATHPANGPAMRGILDAITSAEGVTSLEG